MSASASIRLSDPQKRMLKNIAAGRGSHWGLATQSEWGGAVATLASLKRLGLVDENDNATPAGQAEAAKG